MRKLKIYLETTMFNYYFDKNRDAHFDTVKMFEEVSKGKYIAYTSEYVIDELLEAPEDKRDKMLKLIKSYDITVLRANEDAERLAEIYVDETIIPLKYRMDGIHIAIATVNELDMILSLNFKHIVKKKTIELTELVNIKEGYRKIDIYTPMEVVENEE
jgi:predicted nucleic acid-binding protein